MTDEQNRELERRISERAFNLWLNEGQPDGRHAEHWELAKLAIAIAREDTSPTSPETEPVEAARVTSSPSDRGRQDVGTQAVQETQIKTKKRESA